MSAETQSNNGVREPFGPNNHSVFNLRWKEVSSDVKAEVLNILSRDYEVGVVDEVKQVDAWERNSNNFRVESGSGEYLLRKNIKDNGKTVLFTEHITEHLRKNGVPVPGIIMNRHGGLHALSVGHLWQLFEFVRGTHFRGTEEELGDAGRNIGKLHAALGSLEVDEGRPPKIDWSFEKWSSIFELALDGKGAISKTVRDNQEFLAKEADYVAGAREMYAGCKKQFVHLDLHPHNVIFGDDRLRAFLDFGDVNLSELARDVGQACHRFVRQFIVYQGGGWKELLGRGLKLFLDSYKSENELRKGDFDVIPLLIKDELLRRMYSDLKKHYEEGYSRLVEDGELEKKISLLRESRYFEDAIKAL